MLPRSPAIVGVVAALAITPLFAGSVALFGPEDVVRGKGKPSRVIFTFESGDPSAEHYLRIDNGGADGTLKKVSAAVVWLNGVKVVGPNRLNSRRTEIEKRIRPKEQNTLVVQLRSKPHAGISIRVEAQDDDPPVISNLVPADGTVVPDPEVVVSATIVDSLSGVQAVTCNGSEATPVGTDHACTVPLAEGPNVIEIEATDACGNSSLATLTVIYDPPPVVAITDPIDGAVLFSSPVTVTGTVDDPAADVTVNGVPAVGSAPFTASVPLPIGEQTLTATARDAWGGKGSDSVVVVVLNPGIDPTVAISSPSQDFVIGGPRSTSFPPAIVGVTGRMRVAAPFDAANRPDVTVNGLDASVFMGPAPGPLCATPASICWWDFRADSVSLPEGSVAITAIGVDAQGRSADAEVTGFVDVCVDGGFDGLARVGVGQRNRCHEIDGCSTPDIVAPDVQDPVQGRLGHSSTAFGKDTDVLTPPERFPHGQMPRDLLPCNLHDVCYQTCGSVKVECDDRMFARMNEVCRRAYPESTCPYTITGPLGNTILDPVKCPQWRDEKARCYYWSRVYRDGLASPPAVRKFNERQGEYCEP